MKAIIWFLGIRKIKLCEGWDYEKVFVKEAFFTSAEKEGNGAVQNARGNLDGRCEKNCRVLCDSCGKKISQKAAGFQMIPFYPGQQK